MTKVEIISNVAATQNISKKQATDILESVFNQITQCLKTGEEVVLSGFGKFTVKATAARKGRNPATGAAIDIPAKKKVAFTVHRALKDAVQG